MPKPFPWPLSIGTDICSIPRILSILSQNTGRRFVRRILTPEERDQYQGRVDRPLEKWQETVRRQEQIDRRRIAFGISQSELAHCFELRKVGEAGTPSTWLRELRQQRQEDVGSTISTQSGEGLDFSSRLELGTKGDTLRTRTLGSKPFGTAGEDGNQTYRLAPNQPSKNIASHVPVTVKGGLDDIDDLDLMLRLVDENEIAIKEAKIGLHSAAIFMAGRFAAKEAAMKAHHTQRLTYHRVSILPGAANKSIPGSRPPVSVIIPDGGNWHDGQEVKISISHDGDYATAVCLACDLEIEEVPDLKIDTGVLKREP